MSDPSARDFDPTSGRPSGAAPGVSDSVKDPAPPVTPPTDATATPADAAAGAEPTAVRIDLEKGIEDGLRKLAEEAQHWLKRGQHTRVRIKFRGRELVTLPLSVLIAAEAATLPFAGILRILAVNVVGKAFLDVELINDADAVITRGKELLLEGELDEALAEFQRALAMDPRHANAHLNLGIAQKLKGDRDSARDAFEKAVALDPTGDTGREGRIQLEKLKPRAKGI